jgi:hypothetical protein
MCTSKIHAQSRDFEMGQDNHTQTMAICDTSHRYNLKHYKHRAHNYKESPWEQFTGEISKLEQRDMYLLFCPVFVLGRRLQEGTSHPKWKQLAEQNIYMSYIYTAQLISLHTLDLGSQNKTSITTISRGM